MTHRFDLDDEQRRLHATARQIARDVLAPIAHEGQPGRVSRRLVKALGDAGLLPRLFPRRAGGTAVMDAVSAMDLCILREAIAMECPEAETALALQGLGGYPILAGGSDAIVARWLPSIAKGDAVAAIALTEPDAGSDVAAIALRATRDGADFVLDGEKIWISNAPDADVYALFARTTEGAGAKGVSAFVVPGDAAGLSGTPLELIAPHAIGTLSLEGVRVPASSLIGDLDAGFRTAMRVLDLFRPSVGAFAVGMAQAALDASVRHAGERRQFGKPLREHQAVAHLLANMAIDVDAARLLVHRAASAHDAGEGSSRYAAMAKLFATEAAQRVIDSAIQIHGARALQKGHLLEHLYREVRATRIYEGTSEIQRSIIARELSR
jgi:acyl-CoA dehydrogenase